ncbi:MAG: hypothetical protein ACFFAJ_00655 [Candidatus Hodarchaeota archaeon]
MSPKRIIVQWIICTRSTENAQKPAGFQVSGYKNSRTNQKIPKVGFILSGVKIIAFQQVVNMGIRTRIKWIPNGFEIREEIHPLDGVVVDLQRRNNVLFVSAEDNSMVVMQGEPAVQENGFIGQMIHVDWQTEDIKIVPLQKQSGFHCVLNPKNHRIDCLVK